MLYAWLMEEDIRPSLVDARCSGIIMAPAIEKANGTELGQSSKGLYVMSNSLTPIDGCRMQKTVFFI